jgi:hypothetical protein
MNKMHQCQAMTMKKGQCTKKCTNTYCGMHDPKKCEKRRQFRQFERELLKRERIFLKYVEREVKKNRIKHKKCMERLTLIRHNDSRCKATTKKGTLCTKTSKLKYCHVHIHLDIDVSIIEEPIPVIVHEKEDIIEKKIPIIVHKKEDMIEERNPFIVRRKEIIEEQPCYEISSYMKELESESQLIDLRVYDGPDVDPYRMGRIKGQYKSEMESKVQLYKGMLSMLSNYMSLDEIDLDSIKDDVRISLKMIRKKTDTNVKIFAGIKR